MSRRILGFRHRPEVVEVPVLSNELAAFAAVDAQPAQEMPPADASIGMSDSALAALVMELEITEGELISGPPRRAQKEFTDLMYETYPSVAEQVVVLATEDPSEHVSEWLEVARALSGAKRQQGAGLKAEARERALCIAIAHALEAQARSSARLAGWKDDQLDAPWQPDPRRPGETIWEHYLCREGELVRASLHGEAIGTWLGALGELWQAATDLLDVLDAPYSEGITEARKAARVALRSALVRVDELALW
ncbi:MAG: hypothetical protein ACOYN3_06895 [Acidimicrobiia bacterium]